MNRDKSRELAQLVGVDLKDGHWDVVVFLRQYYQNHGLPIAARTTARALNKHFFSRGGNRYLHRLFAGGPVTQGSGFANLRTPAYDGNSEIFVTSRKTQIAQITRTQGCESTDPTIRDTADTVAFRSTCNLIGNLNPNGVAQVFYYLLVKSDDPLGTAAGCKIEDGCCNEANGCFHPLLGRKQRPPRVAIRPDYTN